VAEGESLLPSSGALIHRFAHHSRV
jgi:hypothetical protein